MMMGAMEGFAILFVLIGIGILVGYVFFCIQWMKLLNECSQENRKMEGGMVWLTWIPVFGIGWTFYVVIQVRDSLKLEFASRGLQTDDPEFGFNLGLAYAILMACTIIPVLGFLSLIAGVVLWILYWLKIIEYYKTLANQNNGQINS